MRTRWSASCAGKDSILVRRTAYACQVLACPTALDPRLPPPTFRPPQAQKHRIGAHHPLLHCPGRAADQTGLRRHSACSWRLCAANRRMRSPQRQRAATSHLPHVRSDSTALPLLPRSSLAPVMSTSATRSYACNYRIAPGRFSGALPFEARFSSSCLAPSSPATFRIRNRGLAPPLYAPSETACFPLRASQARLRWSRHMLKARPVIKHTTLPQVERATLPTDRLGLLPAWFLSALDPRRLPRLAVPSQQGSNRIRYTSCLYRSGTLVSPCRCTWRRGNHHAVEGLHSAGQQAVDPDFSSLLRLTPDTLAVPPPR